MFSVRGIFVLHVKLNFQVAQQLLVGAPFLLTNAKAYVVGAFNLSRVFLYKWSVNWKFIPEDIFLDTRFHVGLLVLHLVLLAGFSYFHWHK